MVIVFGFDAGFPLIEPVDAQRLAKRPEQAACDFSHAAVAFLLEFQCDRISGEVDESETDPVECAENPAVGDAVDGEDIDKNTPFDIRLGGSVLDKAGARVHNFDKVVRIIAVSFIVLDEQIIRQVFLAFFPKAFVIFPEHRHIRVVIPWDKPAVTDGPQQGSGRKGIGEAHFSGRFVKFQQNLQLFFLQLSDCFW